MSSEIMSLEMDVFCLLLLIRILYQMYINREQMIIGTILSYHCLGLCLFVYGCNLDHECKTSSYF